MRQAPTQVLVVADDAALRARVITALGGALAGGIDAREASRAEEAFTGLDPRVRLVVLDEAADDPALHAALPPGTGRIVLADGAEPEVTGGPLRLPRTADAAWLRLCARLAIERAVAERDRLELVFENRELRSFSYEVAHDLRTPLRHLAGFGDQLREEHGDQIGDEGRALLEGMLRLCDRMDAVIRDLLQLARVDRQEIRREPVDLGELARRVVEEQGEPAPALVCPDGVQVHADPRLLRLALHNLLGNARKFTRGVSHPRIELACDASGSEPVYSIADNGVGFGGIEPSRLFRPFVQGHDPGRYGGSGVGLTIVAQVIARHGGRVWAESPPQGGAVFRFTLGQGTDQHSYGSAAGGSHDA